MAAILAAMGLVPGAVSAQPATSAAPEPPAPTAEGAAPTASASAAPVVPATGYGWSTPRRKASPRSPRAARHGDEADALMPGFETLADGSSRLFVELSKPVAYETRTARGAITYVLKGARIEKRNNENPLVTVHFNTPVTSARLVPHGHDLYFVVDLRANVQPTVTVDAGKDGGSMMRIEFPKGDYLPAPASRADSSSAPAPAGSAAGARGGADR
ncbi:MAG TPA: hypothetical protein VKU41_17155 [Polyangiaceae bacterium]|nr:hypothetical protein [Polyangiaceae bacterium]